VDPRTDAFGRALLEWTRGRTDPEIVERDDGWVDTGAGHEVYLAPFDEWPSCERQALRYARGRVADVGCGAGRVALELQSRGLDVIGIDHSPLAIRSSRARGLRRTRELSIYRLEGEMPTIDTVVLFGNGFGIFGSPARARRLMTAWAQVMPAGARILAESSDPYQRAAPEHRAYHRRNRALGRMPGQVRFRVRYRDSATPWFDWLFVSRAEMRRLTRGTGWHVRRFLGPASSNLYVAVLEKD
jgi:SAM-dependent methyltransferase